MGYLADVGRVVSANAEELRGDLDRAMHALHRSSAETAELERQVKSLQALLELAADGVTAQDHQGLTLHEAMRAVLTDASLGMLRAGDLAAEINRRGLYRMRDGRPVEAQQIHARVGHYSHLFTREGTFIKLVT